MTTVPKKRGRPSVWASKITAPDAAIRLYEMIGSLQHSDAFRTCHVYHGALDTRTGVPMFKFEGRVHAMPYIIASYMGLEYGKQTCGTKGCMNPFHFAPPTERVNVDLIKHQVEFAPPQAAGNDWNDLLDYYVEELGVALDYPTLRERIPPEDIDDASLRTAIANFRKAPG